MITRAPRVAFVLEKHVGHRTYAENLRAAVTSRDDIDPIWVPVTYEADGDVPRWLRSAPAPVVARHEVRSGLRDADADVHVFNTQVPAVLGGRLATAQPYVLVTDVTPIQYDAMAAGYGHEPDGSGPLARLKHLANVRTFARASRCVGWSRWAADSMVDDYGVEPARVSVIPPGIDLDEWEPAPEARERERPRLLFVGGEFGRKGGEDLLAMHRELADRCDLWIVTTSPVEPAQGVHVINDLGPNDPRLIELFRTASMFVLPSRAETFGIAAIEAQAAGLPVVASDIGGLADIVDDGVTGHRVPVGDVRALRDAVAGLLDEPARIDAMGIAARARAEANFDSATNADRLVELVREVASEVG